jgi:hypothetical protein
MAGWYSQAGEEAFASNAAYARVSAAKAFPKSLLYPTIAGSVWSALFRGDPTKMSDPEPEREALAHLFAGAIGSHKNPHSHQTVKLSDPREAQEQVMLATYLLRIVDARRPK